MVSSDKLFFEDSLISIPVNSIFYYILPKEINQANIDYTYQLNSSPVFLLNIKTKIYIRDTPEEFMI